MGHNTPSFLLFNDFTMSCLRRHLSLFLCCLSLLSLSVYGNAGAQREPNTIVLSLQPYALLMKSLLAENEQLEVLLEAGVSSHDFQLRPSHMRKLAEADFIIWGGPSLEPSLAKVIGEDLPQLKLDSLQGLVLLSADDEHHGAGEAHEHSIDPHIWLSRDNILLIAKAISRQRAYPPETLRKLQADMSSHLSGMDDAFVQKNSLWVYHDAFRYLEKDLGLSHELVLKPNHNAQIGLRHWQRIRRELERQQKQQGDICLLVQPGFELSADARKFREEVKRSKMDERLRYLVLDPLAYDSNYARYPVFLANLQKQLLDCLS